MSDVATRCASDEELLEAVLEGRPDAFDAFVECYGRRLMAFGMRMCRHTEDAEDVFQETLMKAFLGLKNLRDPKAVRTWLYRVASNQCLMKRRKQQRTPEVSLDAFKPAGWEDGDVPEVPDWSDLPDEESERAELRAVLEHEIGRLPPEYRVVLVLRDVEGLSTRETAEVLGMRAPGVKMRLHRARMALRESLSRHHEAHAAPTGLAGAG
jgi:RNA polymerase sigma-70 factor (ECF subfamily)